MAAWGPPQTYGIGNQTVAWNPLGAPPPTKYSLHQEVMVNSQSQGGWVPAKVMEVYPDGCVLLEYIGTGFTKRIPVEHQDTQMKPAGPAPMPPMQSQQPVAAPPNYGAIGGPMSGPPAYGGPPSGLSPACGGPPPAYGGPEAYGAPPRGIYNAPSGFPADGGSGAPMSQPMSAQPPAVMGGVQASGTYEPGHLTPLKTAAELGASPNAIIMRAPKGPSTVAEVSTLPTAVAPAAADAIYEPGHLTPLKTAAELGASPNAIIMRAPKGPSTSAPVSSLSTLPTAAAPAAIGASYEPGHSTALKTPAELGASANAIVMRAPKAAKVYNAGMEVMVLSDSSGGWVSGTVVGVAPDGIVTVQYGEKEKAIPKEHQATHLSPKPGCAMGMTSAPMAAPMAAEPLQTSVMQASAAPIYAAAPATYTAAPAQMQQMPMEQGTVQYDLAQMPQMPMEHGIVQYDMAQIAAMSEQAEMQGLAGFPQQGAQQAYPPASMYLGR